MSKLIALKLIALLQFLFALCGCDVGGTHFNNRISIDGVDTLVSKAYVASGVARFDCVRSASGVCHYTLFPRDCAPMPQASGKTNCHLQSPLQRFALASGDSRQLTGLPAFRLCVDSDGASPTPDCKVPKSIARR